MLYGAAIDRVSGIRTVVPARPAATVGRCSCAALAEDRVVPVVRLAAFLALIFAFGASGEIASAVRAHAPSAVSAAPATLIAATIAP